MALATNLRPGALATALLAAGAASAATTVFSGVDPGAGAPGSFANSVAAEAALVAAAAGYGTVGKETFEGLATGYYSPIAVPGFTASFVAPNYGNGFNGISDTNLGGNIYGLNLTPGGAKWFGFSDTGATSATFALNFPSHAFGFYLTGAEQSVYGSVFTFKLNNGSQFTGNIAGTGFGGIAYYGIVDTVAFSSVTISSAVNNGDAWGIDDVAFTYNLPSTPGVPEPASWALLITGFALTGATARRRRRGLAA
ncbi:hypothetical protein IP88_10520 [alpha proteobacterium AAP81b]|nr:hypothetical protein IP88_10520 [alpha proteobacterium AAP81b]